MFGTVAKYRLKPGRKEQFLRQLQEFEAKPPAGWVYHTLFQATKDPNDLWISVVFDSEDAYRKNASSPEMDRQYRRMLDNLEGEPEWHDGNVIHEGMRQHAKA